MPWGDLQWGSCQYDTIADMYYRMLLCDSVQDALAAIGAEISFDRMMDFEIFKETILNEAKDDAKLDDDPEYWDEQIAALEKANNMDELFVCWRGCAHDLWYALNTAKDVFINLNISDIPKSATVGPPMNLAVQADNPVLGIIAALLKQEGYIKDEDSFKNFDT